jgi:protein SCO1/2
MEQNFATYIPNTLADDLHADYMFRRVNSISDCGALARVAALIIITMLIPGTLAARAVAHGESPRPRGVLLSPLFQLATHHGRPFTKAEIQGRPFIVVFGFTDCPSVCPTALLETTNLLSDLGPDADRIKVLFVSVDPERDTPDRLREFLTSFDQRIIGLTGEEIDIAAVTHAFEAEYEKVYDGRGDYTVDHTTRIYVMDRYGLLAATFDSETGERARRSILRRVLRQ